MRLRLAALAIVLAAAAGRAAGADDDEAFRRWATKLAETQHRPICAWGGLAHSDSKIPGRFVWFNDRTQPHVNWLVFESGGRRWLFRTEERAAWGGRELACAPGAGLQWTKLGDLPLNFGEQSNVSDYEETITFLDGDLVLLSDNEVGYHDADRTSWIEGTHTWNDPPPLDDSPPEESPHMLFALPGMGLATLFISLPFVCREVVPTLREIGNEQEQAAHTQGASGWQTFWRVTLPAIRWAVIYGVVLTTARCLGDVEIMPGTEGLVHISEMRHERTEKTEDVVKKGDRVKVKLIDRDERGRLRLSMKALVPRPEGMPEPEPGSGGGGEHGGRRDGGDRGERGDRGGRPRRGARGGERSRRE